MAAAPGPGGQAAGTGLGGFCASGRKRGPDGTGCPGQAEQGPLEYLGLSGFGAGGGQSLF